MGRKQVARTVDGHSLGGEKGDSGIRSSSSCQGHHQSLEQLDRCQLQTNMRISIVLYLLVRVGAIYCVTVLLFSKGICA
jgi:hypothetical protein